MDKQSWLALILLSLLWGGSFFFIEIVLKGLPVFTIVFLGGSILYLVLLLL